METKKRQNTKAMDRAMKLIGISDPCQLGGLQKLLSDTLDDCRILDPSAGKFPAPAGEIRHWSDKIRGYQRMSSKGHKSKNRSGNCKVDAKRGRPSELGCYADRQNVKG